MRRSHQKSQKMGEEVEGGGEGEGEDFMNVSGILQLNLGIYWSCGTLEA